MNTSIVLQEKSQSGVNQFVVLWPVFAVMGEGASTFVHIYVDKLNVRYIGGRN